MLRRVLLSAFICAFQPLIVDSVEDGYAENPPPMPLRIDFTTLAEDCRSDLASLGFACKEQMAFLGLFLGEHEPVLHPFTSENYPENGKYVCLGNPPPGQRIVSRLDLGVAFRDWFGNRPVPPLTGIAIEVDTRGLAEEQGTSSAFIHHIGLSKAN